MNLSQAIFSNEVKHLRVRQEITWVIPIVNVLQIQLVLYPRNRSVACYERISRIQNQLKMWCSYELENPSYFFPSP